jgi:hypothetical protein
MGWIEKDKPTPFDDRPIEGLFFSMAICSPRLFERDWTVNQKYPMIAFPSGVERELWEAATWRPAASCTVW